MLYPKLEVLDRKFEVLPPDLTACEQPLISPAGLCVMTPEIKSIRFQLKIATKRTRDGSLIGPHTFATVVNLVLTVENTAYADTRECQIFRSE